MPYRGKLYRALNPVFAREPLSGRGAALHGGRFNRKGRPTLYTSLSIMTALREANQVGSLQPTTLVCYEATIDQVADTRDRQLLASHGMDEEALAASDWRDAMRERGSARTQDFACDLIAEGYAALLVRSFAPGTSSTDLNLVLWSWSDVGNALLALIDDENRLST
jgi:RES domain-containing protein